ncbi:hypothetical protein BJS_04729 [Bradyrhizobium japonicum SEMIA 5079]|nr:hypothetical protein BJS_04729 [Bradyrhizobium japonicum SEMIA 5079]
MGTARKERAFAHPTNFSIKDTFMASIHNDISLPVPARDVWDAVRDFGALPQRLAPGFVTACTLDGDARIVTFANGSVAREVLVDRDDARQRLVYAINNERLRHYSASVQVIAEGEASCRLVWIIDMLPNELAAYVQGQTRDAVAAIHRAFPAVAA